MFQLHMIGENTRGAIVEQGLIKFMQKGAFFYLLISLIVLYSKE